MILEPKFPEKKVVFNQICIFKFTNFLGVQKDPKLKIWVKIDATVSKKKAKYHCDVSFYPIFKILVSKFS